MRPVLNGATSKPLAPRDQLSSTKVRPDQPFALGNIQMLLGHAAQEIDGRIGTWELFNRQALLRLHLFCPARCLPKLVGDCEAEGELRLYVRFVGSLRQGGPCPVEQATNFEEGLLCLGPEIRDPADEPFGCFWFTHGRHATVRRRRWKRSRSSRLANAPEAERSRSALGLR